jgi:trans-2,3-dihydro-3-hydroxyanthranilate isomerase
MAKRYPFALVDVFAASPLSGNALAVVGDADDLDEPTMRAIAGEASQAETTFLLAPEHSGSTARLRSFTAIGEEVVGAGHNSLGAWWWLAATGRVSLEGPGDFVQEIGGERLPVVVEHRGGVPTGVVLRQSAPRMLAPLPTAEPLAAALGVPPSAVVVEHSRVVSTGAEHLMARLGSVADLRGVHPDPRALHGVLASLGAEGCYAFTAEDPRRPEARFFNPTVGIVEDTATGTAAGPLAAHLVGLGLVPDGTEVSVQQGASLGRPSELRVRVNGDRVELSGRCAISVEGLLTPR